MISKTDADFWKCYNALPANIQALAKEKFLLWQEHPHHSSLKFEERRRGGCVVRIGNHYRAIGLKDGDVISWFWIGTHEEYNRFRF